MKKLYAGIDLHSNNSLIVIIDAEGNEVHHKRLRNDFETVEQYLSAFSPDLREVVVESTYNWYWLVDGLMERDYTVHLANTGAIQKYSGLKHADDNSDAYWLANMLCLGILPEGYIYPKEERAIRDLLRKRAFLVRQQTSNVLSIKNIMTRNTGMTLSASTIKRLSDNEIDGMFANPNLALSLKGSLRTQRVQSEQIAIIEKAALEQVRLRDAYQNLLTVKGIGVVLALTIMLETGDIHRFPTVGDYASYSRCVSSAYFSNGKKKGKGNTKNGNRYLGWAFIEAANFAIRYEPTIQRYYQRRKDSGKHLASVRATVAHKLANACYHMLWNKTAFDVNRAFS